ncbi:hypothetical protein [uncultured Maribacter sp.]|uniref:hypothetical protein n=1 Tax=uncultured Maribacter sp. TaxID=431308 RepID=UPI0026286B2A|nr:hypothetical protein [uncultured Maribacter sp.]
MKKLVSISIISFIIMSILVGCDDVFEEDITKDSIITNSPKSNDIVVGNSVNFDWETIEGASDYRVKVIEDNTNKIVIDSLVEIDFLSVPIVSGTYSWEVRGENFAYQTAYSLPQNFVVESTNDLSTQNVFLNLPSDNFYTKNNTIILNWSTLDAATHYRLKVEKVVANNSSIVLQIDEILTSDYTLDSTVLEEDAIYTWSIQAVNDNGQTEFSSRKIFIDTTIPNQATLITPNDEAKVTSTVDFSWSLGEDMGEVQSSLESFLEISTDQNFTTILKEYTIQGESQQHIFELVGEYYWRVTSMDIAGNIGTFSTSRILTVE